MILIVRTNRSLGRTTSQVEIRGFSGKAILDMAYRMFVLCHHDFCALSRVSFVDTTMTLLLKYAECNGDFTSIDKSVLSNFEL